MNHPTLKDFKKVLQTDFATFFLNESGDTLISQFKASTHITIEVGKEAIAVTKPIKDGGSRYAIIDFTAKSLSITDECRKHFKENISPHNTYLVAVVISEVATRMIANVYARFDKPKVPTRVFNEIEEAKKWIEENKI